MKMVIVLVVCLALSAASASAMQMPCPCAGLQGLYGAGAGLTTMMGAGGLYPYAEYLRQPQCSPLAAAPYYAGCGQPSAMFQPLRQQCCQQQMRMMDVQSVAQQLQMMMQQPVRASSDAAAAAAAGSPGSQPHGHDDGAEHAGHGWTLPVPAAQLPHQPLWRLRCHSALLLIHDIWEISSIHLSLSIYVIMQ
uniref:Uncharacterized protein n=1 Tax=Zea mays TaxID=4577 RepID=C0PNL4_MAIZE|nr:unknown [Zea mays]